jgi:predicted Zn-ribbon and HTH transcriptional regulator
MALKTNNICKDCGFEFSFCDGGTRNGSYKSYFCYECLKTTSRFSLYRENQKDPRPELLYYIKDTYLNHLSKLNENEKELFKQHLNSYTSNQTPPPEVLKEQISVYEKDLKEYLERNPNKINLEPTCGFCNQDTLIEFEKLRCPVCNSSKLKVSKRAIID